MKFHIKTFGCKVNQYESQLLSERLEAAGHPRAGGMEDAGLVIINSCTVTHGADADCRQAVRRALKSNAASRVMATGCMAEASPGEIRKISARVEVLADKQELARMFSGPDLSPGGITRFEGHRRAFVKVQDGCDAFCSYCIVPFVRGKLSSRKAADIVAEVRSLSDNGCTEAVLCGIRLGKYRDGKTGLPGLIREVLAGVPRVRVALSSLELEEVTDELLGLMASGSGISRHLHLPLQSGDDGVLEAMGRPYRSAEFAAKIAKIRKTLPGARITTDVIAGFPGETERQFGNTLDFIAGCGFDGLHPFRYSARAGTAIEKKVAAGGVKRVGPDEMKRRVKALKELVPATAAVKVRK